MINDFAKKIVRVIMEDNQNIENVKMKNDELKETKTKEKELFNQILQKMSSCKICIADFKDFELTANYYFKNQTIYLNKEKTYIKLDEYTIHEFIHFFQDIRDKGLLKKFGLCECLDSKLLGVGLNEASVQYITNKILGMELEDYVFHNIKFKTRNKNDYPLMSNLMEQIVYLIGEKELIDSTLNCKADFKDIFIDFCGEKAYKELLVVFDKLLDTENDLYENYDEKLYEKVKMLYEKGQNIILSSYFINYFCLIETSKELEDYQEKLFGIKELISDVDNYVFYEDLKERQSKLIKKRIIKMNKKFAEKALIKREGNLFSKIFFKLRSFYNREWN